MLYAADQLIQTKFTPALVNAQLAALETALGVTVTDLAAVMDGLAESPQEEDVDAPLLVRYVGEEGGRGQLSFAGKRDTMVPVRLLHLSRHADLASGALDIRVGLEALQTVLETLIGAQHGATQRFCANVLDPIVQVVGYRVNESVIRQGGEMRFTMLMRSEGV